ncbi:MAG: PorV/PorQ family protein [bacterium]|nr:PorV/PorQ family protein [bacterium]
MKYIISICWILSLLSGLLRAGNEFLLLNPGSEGTGRGNTGTAQYSDISSVLLNPASSLKNNKPQVSFTYMVVNNSMNYNYLGLGFPAFNGTASLHLVYLYFPNTEELLGGEETGELVNYNDMALMLSDSFRIRGLFDAGISLKYVKREISDVKGDTLAADMGLIREFSFLDREKHSRNNLSLGLSLKNLGGKIKFMEESEDLPLTLSLGMKYSPYRAVAFLYDLSKTIHEETGHYLGLEYSSPFYLIPRMGLKMEEETVLMIGLGLQYRTGYIRFKLDYSHNLLGQAIKSHSFSLNLEIEPIVRIMRSEVRTNTVIRERVKERDVSTNRSRIRRIAVLHFENTSRSSDLEYLSQTIPESISTYLARQTNLRIMDRQKVEDKLKSLSVNLSDFRSDSEMQLLGKLLSVDTVISGSYVDVSNQIRINTRLVDTGSGDVIVADQLQSEMNKDIFVLLDRTSQYVLTKIRELNRNSPDTR